MQRVVLFDGPHDVATSTSTCPLGFRRHFAFRLSHPRVHRALAITDGVASVEAVRLRDHETAVGYANARLGRIPEVGDAVLVDDTRIEVAEMYVRRITLVSVAPAAAADNVEERRT